MLRSKFIVAVALVLGLAGCQSGTGANPDVQKVIDTAKQVCSFEPTVQSVTAMLAATNPQVAGAVAIAHAICDQINKAQALDTENKAAPKTGDCPLGAVNGVCIEGKKLDNDNAKSSAKTGDCPLGEVNGVCIEGKKSE